MKKTLILILMGSALMSCAPESAVNKDAKTESLRIISSPANYITYNSLNDLKSAADIIVLGRPLKDFQQRETALKKTADDVMYDFHTLTDIHVSKWIKGSDLIKGNKISVIEPVMLSSREGESVILTTEGYTQMDRKDEYMIFIKSNGRGGYGVINMNNGKYSITELKGGISQKSSSPSHGEQEDIREQIKKSILQEYGKDI